MGVESYIAVHPQPRTNPAPALVAHVVIMLGSCPPISHDTTADAGPSLRSRGPS